MLTCNSETGSDQCHENERSSPSSLQMSVIKWKPLLRARESVIRRGGEVKKATKGADGGALELKVTCSRNSFPACPIPKRATSKQKTQVW